MSGSVLLTPRRRGFRGPEEDENVGAAVSALLETQQVASRALEEGAIAEDAYREYLARADAIDAEIAAAGETPTPGAARSARAHAEALLGEVSSTRVSGGATHRSNVWIAMIASVIASVLMVAGLAAWANRRKR